MSFLSAIPQLSQIPGLQAALDAKAALASPTFTSKVVISGGTITADAPSFDLSQTWNNAAVDFTAAKVNVTNTASGAGSKVHDWQVGGVSMAAVFKNGDFGITTLGWGQFKVTQHDTYGIGIKSPDGNWVFAAQNDGGLAALNLLASSTGRIGFKTTSFASGATWSNHSVGLERISDTQLKISSSGGALADWSARRGALSEYLDVSEMTAPGAPGANTARIYCDDSGGKSRLMVRFPSGAAQQLAIEP